MVFVKTLKVELDEKEKDAIEKVLYMLDTMWAVSDNNDMEDLWETYGSEDEGWTCIEETLRNLLRGEK